MIATLSASLFAQMPMMGGPGGGPGGLALRSSYVAAEKQAIEKELLSRPFGELSLGELLPYETRLGLALRKDAYVAHASMASMHLPGLGQFRTGATGAGLGFLALHLALFSGGLVGSYFLLPADLRFDAIDYLNAPLATIRTAWQGKSLTQLLPSMAVMAAGMVLDGGLRFWSAVDARRGARAAIDSGRVKIEALAGPGFIGMGMHF
jgi:hypothetical protein